jgi:glycerophosphoryl diester phosphodiesterase
MLAKLIAVAVAAASATPLFAASFATLDGTAPLVIAHRGASGYLPEHTLGAYELAIQLGADIVEPDVLLTADGEAIVMHDTTLTRTTDIEARFAPRNGGYAVADFTLAEIKTLTVDPTGTAATSYPGFTPSMADPYKVPTFAEFLAYVRDYNNTNGTRIGVYPESKIPATTSQNTKIVDLMQAYGFTAADQNSYLQTFDHFAARQLADLQAARGMTVPVAALGAAVATGSGFGVFDFVNGTLSPLADLATFAGGVGVALASSDLNADFVSAAHAVGLEVHGWTFNIADPIAAADQYGSFIGMGLDGLFTNYTDLAVAAVARAASTPVPVPAGLPLLLSGLGVMATLTARRTRRA